jgi:hypothetical protein
MNAAHETRLWTRHVEFEAQWREVAVYLGERLREFLGFEVRVEPMTLLELDAFSCRLRGGAAFGGALQLEWSGVLGMEPIEDQSHVSASLFLFSQRRRLQLAGQLGSSLELVFERREDGPGQWINLGWHDDVYGEYEGVAL